MSNSTAGILQVEENLQLQLSAYLQLLLSIDNGKQHSQWAIRWQISKHIKAVVRICAPGYTVQLSLIVQFDVKYQIYQIHVAHFCASSLNM